MVAFAIAGLPKKNQKIIIIIIIIIFSKYSDFGSFLSTVSSKVLQTTSTSTSPLPLPEAPPPFPCRLSESVRGYNIKSVDEDEYM